MTDVCHRVKKKRQGRDESQQPAEQNVTSHLYCHLGLLKHYKKKLESHLIVVMFWPSDSRHPLNVEANAVVEGGAAVEGDPEESQSEVLTARSLILGMGDDRCNQEGETKQDV